MKSYHVMNDKQETEAVHKLDVATAENSSAIGNGANLRETLQAVKHYLDGYVTNMWELRRKVDAALAKPARNCDRFDDLNSAQRYYIEHGCPKGLGKIVDGEIRKTPWKSRFEKWLFDKEKGETDGR